MPSCRATNCLSKIIVCTPDDGPSVIVAAFTLSNDSVKKISGSRKKKVEKNIPRFNDLFNGYVMYLDSWK
jgi:hypothetical protein